MKAISRAAFVAAILAFGAGCAGTAGPGAPVPGVVSTGTVTVKGRVAIPAAPYRVAAVVEPYGAGDITAIEVFLRRGDDAEIPLGPVAGADATIQIANLKMDTAYTVRLEAYTTVDGEEVRIDAGDESCVTPFETGHDDLITDQAFQLKLTRVFAGTAEATVDLTPGSVIDATSAVDVSERQGD